MIAAIFRWLFLLIADTAMFLAAWVLAPILPAFAIGRDHLPRWLAWFDTPDNPLDGDLGYVMLHAPFKGYGVTGIKRYINRVWWLVRNPGYGFSYTMLGARIDSLPLVVSGDPYVSDSPNLTIGRMRGFSGHVLLRSGTAFEFYLVRQYGQSGRCFRLRLGWKMLGFLNEPIAWPLGGRAQFVCGIKPLGRFVR